MEKLSYQQWCIDTIEYILKNKENYRGELRDQGYIYVIKAIINHYSSMYYYDELSAGFNKEKRHINMWWDHLNRKNYEKVFSNIVMSQEAKKKIQNCVLDGADPKKLENELHFEHITPMGYSFEKIISLTGNDINAANISKAFSYATVILLTKKEAQYLDGAGCIFTAGDYNSFEDNGIASEDDLIEAKAQINMRLKDHGSGLLRTWYLVNKDVKFCTLQSDEIDVFEYLKNLEPDYRLK